MSARFRKGYFVKADSSVYQAYEGLSTGAITAVPAVEGDNDVSFEAGYFVPRM